MEWIVLSESFFLSSVCDLPASARLAWLAVLFEAQKSAGLVHLNAGVLARNARITNGEAEAAIAAFLAEDPLSEDTANAGRRLVPTETGGGWYRVVGWEQFRKDRARYFARERQKRYRTRKLAATGESCS